MALALVYQFSDSEKYYEFKWVKVHLYEYDWTLLVSW